MRYLGGGGVNKPLVGTPSYPRHFKSEEDAFQLRRQLKQESTVRASSNHHPDDMTSASSAYLSLHDELNGTSTSTISDQSEPSSRSGDEATTEWKTKFDVMSVEHERQKK